jgi:hypothetical protein
MSPTRLALGRPTTLDIVEGLSEKLIPEKFARVIRSQIRAARSIAQMGKQR